MAIGEIDLNLPTMNLELFLTKPNREIIAKISEAYNKKMTLKLGNINEITFTIPYDVDKNRKIIVNPHINLLRERYLIKAVFAEKVEWYKIISIVDSMNEGDSMDVTCYLLPYELSDKNLRVFEESALNLDQVMNGGTIIDPDSGTNYQIDGILSETLWKVGYVDADIASKYRGYSFSSTTVLDAVFKVAETLNALIVWNTISKTISFFNAENYGINRGFTINYGRYLKSLSRESKSDEMVTRLKVFGKDGMSIQRLNINGQNYLEDYSFFLYPFQRDANHNVVEHSYYMSDQLCHAILDYSEYMTSKRNQFTNLLSQRTPFEQALTTKKNELATLQEQMAVIDNNIDINKSMNYDYASLIIQKNAKQSEINSKNGEISLINSSLTSIDTQITVLKNSLKYNVFFTPQLLEELVEYTVYKEFSNDAYIDDQLLYDDSLKEFEKVKLPQVILTMDIVNFMNIVESQRDWDKLNLGDIITIRYGKLNINMEAKIIEVIFDFESDNIGLTIANTKDILTDEEKLVKMIYSNNAASTLLDLKSTKWDGIEATTSKVNAIIENTWDAIKTGIEGGVNNTISITERGILVKNTTDPSNFLIIQNGVLAITNDNGNTWKHAITANGIVGERIYGKLLAGSNLVIDASDSSGVKTFTVDGSGVKILGSKLIISGGITEANLSEDFLNSLDADIAQVQNAVDELEINVNEILSDSMITSIEANTLKVSLAQVTSESADIIAAATTLGITTEKNAYSLSLSNLTTEINKWIDKTYPMEISLTDRTNIKAKFSDIQARKSSLINAISAKRQALSQTYTDNKITTVNNAIDILDSDISLFSSDNVITLAESNALKLSLSQVNSESVDLISVASALGITTERTNYSSALSTLTTEVNKWINKTYPLNIAASDRASIKTKFDSLQSTKTILINKIAAVREQRAKDASVGLGLTYNGVVIDAANGLVITKSDGAVRTILNATDGFSFEKKVGSSWEKRLYYSVTTGNMVLDGEFNAKSIKIGGVEVIAGNKIDGDMIDSIKVQQLDASTAKIGSAMIETLYIGRDVFMAPEATISWNQISNQPFIPIQPAYITATKITQTTIESPSIFGGTIAIGSGNNIFKADGNGIYLGNASYSSAPFKVGMNGALSATSATISGTITGSTISASTIVGTSVATGNSADSRVVLSSWLADINMYHLGSNLFRIEDGVSVAWLYSPTGASMRIGSDGANVYAWGIWDFTRATVTGVKAVFG